MDSHADSQAPLHIKASLSNQSRIEITTSQSAAYPTFESGPRFCSLSCQTQSEQGRSSCQQLITYAQKIISQQFGLSFLKNGHEPSLLTTQPTSKMTFKDKNKEQKVIPHRNNTHRTKIFDGQIFCHSIEFSSILYNFCLTFVFRYQTKYPWTKNFPDKLFVIIANFCQFCPKGILLEAIVFIGAGNPNFENFKKGGT